MAFIVNQKGATHSVPDEWLDTLIASGARLATPDEIARWYAEQGLEVPDEVIDGTSRHKAQKSAAK